MNYADIKYIDVANGIGIRVSVFVSGCTHHCKNCFNREAWDFQYGKPFTQDTIRQVLDYLKPDHIRGLSLLGGEPLEHSNQIGLLPLLRKVKEIYPKKDIWCFTGYDFEKDILAHMCKVWAETRELLSYLDVLVDGEFIEERKDLALRFKGSSNQRSILVKPSLAQNRVVLWDTTKDELVPL